MPLPHDEGETVELSGFGGQASRPPKTLVPLKRAVTAECSRHDSGVIARAPGTEKLVSSPLPASCFELNGLETGILELTLPPAFDTSWNNESLGVTKTVQIVFAARFLGSQLLTDELDQLVFASADDLFTPAGTSNSIHLYLTLVVNGAGKTVPGFRLEWGSSFSEFATEDTAPSNTRFDFTDWMELTIHLQQGSPATTLTFTARQVINGVLRTCTKAIVSGGGKTWVMRRPRIGGRLPPRYPFFGIEVPCRMLVSEVVAAVGAGTIQILTSALTWVRTTTISGIIKEVWPLVEHETRPAGIGGNLAVMIGNRVHRTPAMLSGTGSLYFDGSGGVFLKDASVLRHPPSTEIPMHYLERPELTIGMWFQAKNKWPFVNELLSGSCKRSTIWCWSTPKATNLGVPSDPVGAAGDRPSEHLRAEIFYDTGTGLVYLEVHFGELEPQSLKHPTGVPGGSISTTWPPNGDIDGNPPPTWNKPIEQGGGSYNSAKSPALRILLGNVSDPTHPLAYSYLLFAQRRWVGQSDPDNRVSIYMYRYNNGVLDTAAGPGADGEMRDTVTEFKVPVNQSCYTARRQGVIDINFSTAAYAFSIGTACPSWYGDEKGKALGKGWASGHLDGMRPVSGAPGGFILTDRAEGFPFVGTAQHFFALKQYLGKEDRLRLARAGAFGSDMQYAFAGQLIVHLPMNEGHGSILREFGGRDSAFHPVDSKIIVGRISNNPITKIPDFVGLFPRVPPPWHNEATIWTAEVTAVSGIVQRIDRTGAEELLVTARCGLYEYLRASRSLRRIITLPGQGASGPSSFAIDTADAIHIAGGPARPLIYTRNKIVAYSGIDAPLYGAPDGIVTVPTSLAGGVGVVFENTSNTSLDPLKLFEIPSRSKMTIAIGFYSDILKARSAPGPVFTVRFSDPNETNQNLGATTIYYRYRVRLLGLLPRPSGFNASLVTHWEIFRTEPDGKTLLLETRVPIGDLAPECRVGYKAPEELGEEANFFRYPPPEGMRYITMFGQRMWGVRTETEARQIQHTTLRDAANWPPTYRRQLEQTQTPATGIRARKDRVLITSRDHLYEGLSDSNDADPEGRIQSPVEITTLSDKVGAFNQLGIAEDSENGLYLPGLQSIYVTEGGVLRRPSRLNDSDSSLGESWKYPDCFSLADMDRFVAFNDERRNAIVLCGPAADDPSRIDALVLYYDHVEFTEDGRPVSVPEMTRIKGVQVTCAAEVIDPATGKKEVWIGDSLGYLKRYGFAQSLGVDYTWLTVKPKAGKIIAVIDTFTVRVEGSFSSFPADVFRGAPVYFMRDEVILSIGVVQSVAASASWADIRMHKVHGAAVGDDWIAGGLPCDWVSGQQAVGSQMATKRIHSVDVRFV